MTAPLQATIPVVPVSVMDAIYQRRSVRDYTLKKIDKATITKLLDAAIHAPTAMHEEAWAFAIVQDRGLLNRLSDKAKELWTQDNDKIALLHGSPSHDHFMTPDFNAFYNAGTLIIVCGKPMGPFVASDCWLASENLMLAAHAFGLGSCVIGLAVTALNTQEWKKELGIAADMTAIAPIIVGVPSGVTSSVPRKEPEILYWK